MLNEIRQKHEKSYAWPNANVWIASRALGLLLPSSRKLLMLILKMRISFARNGWKEKVYNKNAIFRISAKSRQNGLQKLESGKSGFGRALWYQAPVITTGACNEEFTFLP
jgi:hypothetical protein